MSSRVKDIDRCWWAWVKYDLSSNTCNYGK